MFASCANKSFLRTNMAASDLKANLELIRHSTLKIFRQEEISISEWHGLSSLVYFVNMTRQGEREMYSALKLDILATVEVSKQQLTNYDDSRAFVKAYLDEWTKFLTACTKLTTIIRRTDRSVSVHDPNRQKVRIVMYNAWNEIILSDIKRNMRHCVAELINGERNGNGQVCDPHLIIGIRKSYVELGSVRLHDKKSKQIEWDLEEMFGCNPQVNQCVIHVDKLVVYRELFEADYFKNTRAFYRTKASEYLMANGVLNYIKYADLMIKEENVRIIRYLESDPVSQGVLTGIWEGLFVVPFKGVILGEFEGIVKRNDVENLQIMYRLMSLVPDGFAPMLGVMEQHVVDACLADVGTIQELLDLFRRFNELIEVAFQNNSRFLSSRDKAFKRIINDPAVFKSQVGESKCAELMAHFCDMLLRKTQLRKKLTSEDVESTLKDVVSLLKYVNNKDVFMTYYTSHLTRRLILETSADSETEEEMVVWFNDIEVPGDYMFKFLQMFRDLEVSRDVNESFKLYSRKESINIKIFSASAWARPNDKISGMRPVLPVELEDYISGMEEFYKKQHSGRKLVWQHQLSNGIISFVNSVGKFNLEVTTFQVAVLFAWNERPDERISYEDLRLATELPDAELRKTMWSLVSVPMAKRGVLLCHPEAKSPVDFKNDSPFWINEEFGLIKSGKVQKRGTVNLIGRLQI